MRPKFQKDQRLQNYQEAYDRILAIEAGGAFEQTVESLLDNDVERAVLGALMFSANHADEVLERLGYGSYGDAPFYLQKHIEIYVACTNLAKKSAPIDLISLTNELRATDRLNAIGGPAYLMELATNVTYLRAGELKHHCQILLDLHCRRRLVLESSMLRIAALDYKNLKTPKEIIEQHETAIFNLLGVGSKGKGMQTMASVVKAARQEIADTTMDGESLPGYQSGIHSLDNLIGGFMKGEVWCIAARPSDGKTALAITIAHNIAFNPKPEKRTGVAFFSLEMKDTRIGVRFLGNHGRINTVHLQRNRMTDWEIKELPKAVREMEAANIFIDDSSNLSALDIKSRLKRLMHSQDIGVCVIDYLQIMDSHDKNSNDTRDREVGKISKAVHDFTKELDIATIICSQMNRSQTTTNRPPVLSDLRESGSIEQDMDGVIFIYDPDKKSNADESAQYYDGHGRSLLLCVEKNRNGMTDQARTRFHKEFSLFESSAAAVAPPPEPPRLNYKPRAQFTGASTPEYQPSLSDAFVPADVDPNDFFDDDPF